MLVAAVEAVRGGQFVPFELIPVVVLWDVLVEVYFALVVIAEIAPHLFLLSLPLYKCVLALPLASLVLLVRWGVVCSADGPIVARMN